MKKIATAANSHQKETSNDSLPQWQKKMFYRLQIDEKSGKEVEIWYTAAEMVDFIREENKKRCR